MLTVSSVNGLKQELNFLGISIILVIHIFEREMGKAIRYSSWTLLSITTSRLKYRCSCPTSSSIPASCGYVLYEAAG